MTEAPVRDTMLDPGGAARMLAFLTNVFRLYREDRFHASLAAAARSSDQEEAIYRTVQSQLGRLRPPLSGPVYGIRALAKQKAIIGGQIVQLYGHQRTVSGCLEIGSTGRYISALRRHLRVASPLWVVHDAPPRFTPDDILERGGLRRLGAYLPLADYAPLPASVPADSLDMVICAIGLHHIAPERLDPFLASVSRVLRPGGSLILRDHDASSAEMSTFCSAIHSVFNCGTGVPWESNRSEVRLFQPLSFWIALAARHGLQAQPDRLYQDGDPSANALMRMCKAR